ncbi:MAG: hypothetical protein JNM20_19445, partial [Rhizobiales bacterium]|nr:hypothetical protein [Hyphomicrobiales bacterium]
MTVDTFPQAARALLEFPQGLRDHRFTIGGDQALAFMASAPLLAPLNLRRLHRAAHATLAPPPERHAEFDALFHQYFAGDGAGVVAAKSLPEHDAPVSEGVGAHQVMAERRRLNESGKGATESEALGIRRLRSQSDLLLARQLRSKLPHRLRLRQQRM